MDRLDVRERADTPETPDRPDRSDIPDRPDPSRSLIIIMILLYVISELGSTYPPYIIVQLGGGDALLLLYCNTAIPHDCSGEEQQPKDKRLLGRNQEENILACMSL